MSTLDRKQRLLEAVKSSNLALLESVSKDGGNANQIFPNGKTLLIMAIEKQHRKMVDFLVQAGANVDQRDLYDRTPLMYAADRAAVAIAQILIEAGADVNSRNKHGRTALMYAAHNDAVEMTETLLNAGADVHARDRQGRSALNYATYKKGRLCHNLLKSRSTHNRLSKSKVWIVRFLSRLRAAFSADEFSEVKNPPAYPEPRGNWIVYVFIGVPILLAYLPRWSIVHWLTLAWVGWYLLVWFPSIWSIFPLGWEILQIYLWKSPVNEPNRLQPARRIDAQNDVGFVSLLMDLGTRELSSLHHTHFDRQSLPVKQSLFTSRLLSMLLAGSIFVVVLMFLAYDSAQGIGKTGLDNVTILSFLAICVLYLSLWAIRRWIQTTFRLEETLRARRLRLVQIDRDRLAGEISKMLEAEELRGKELPAEFGLYLRAFMTTDKLRIKGLDFETMLAYSIAPTLPLVALGKPGEHVGAGRVRTTEEYWREKILQFLEAALLILIIPSHRPGTLWEISTLRERGYFSKTIFIMPPELKFHGGAYSHDWQKTVAAARKVGVEFPFHIPTGAFFRLNSNGELEDYAPCLPEEFMQEIELQLPFEAEAGGSVAAAVEESSGIMAAGGAVQHAHEAYHPHALDPFHEVDSGLGADYASSGTEDTASEYGDVGYYDDSDAGSYSW